MDQEKIVYQWEVKGEKKDSNTIMGLIVIAIFTILAIGYNIYIREWFAVVAFALVLAILIWYIIAQKKDMRVALTENKVNINDQSYDLEKFKAYSISAKNQTIYLIQKKKTTTIVSIPLGSAKLETIKSALSGKLIETEKEIDSIADRITRTLHL